MNDEQRIYKNRKNDNRKHSQNNSVTKTVVTSIYKSFLAGASIESNVPQWIYDLWSEAQERKSF